MSRDLSGGVVSCFVVHTPPETEWTKGFTAVFFLKRFRGPMKVVPDCSWKNRVRFALPGTNGNLYAKMTSETTAEAANTDSMTEDIVKT
jgi:hypothetical protein